MSKNKIQFSSPTASPSGKRLKPATDANDAILQALEQQQGKLEAMVEKVLKEELGSMKDSINALQKDLAEHMAAMKGLGDKVDRIHSETRGLKRDVVAVKSDVDKLQEKLIELDDRGRRNNIRLVNLAANREGGDTIRFLQKMLPKWIPSLGTEPVQIERAHRIYHSMPNKANRPQTLIFKVLNYQDRQAILQGARAAKKNNTPIKDEGRELLFFADYSTYTSESRRAFKVVRKDLWAKGISTFLIYPATLRVTYQGRQLSFETVQEAENFRNQLSDDRPTSFANSSRRMLPFAAQEEESMETKASMDEGAPAGTMENSHK